MVEAMAQTIAREVQPEEVVLFGSRARGTGQGRSDVDLLVIMPENEQNRRERRRISGAIYRCIASFPVAKDILVYTRGEVERWREVTGHVVATSLSEGKRLYGQE